MLGHLSDVVYAATTKILSALTAIAGIPLLFTGTPYQGASAAAALPPEIPQWNSVATTTIATTTLAGQALSGQAIINQYITQPVVEHTVEKVLPPDDALATRLQLLDDRVTSQLATLSAALSQPQHSYVPVASFAASQRIDNLANVTITNPTITGGSVTATAYSGMIGIGQGGTGTSTAPAYGQVLLGNNSGGYTLTATSSLGINTTTAWGAITGTLSDQSDLQDAFNGKLSLSAWYATTTDALTQGSTNKYYSDTLVNTYIHASTTVPKTYTANVFSALQQFTNASTTILSVADGVATTTILSNATSTFGAGLSASYLNLTGTSATSTAANGFNLSAGCFAVNGTCVGGSASQWTTSGSNIYFNTGSVLIGTTTPGRTLTVFNTAANAQQRISYDATRYAEFYVDASGDLQISATGKNIRALDANLYLCDGGACPTTPVQGYPSFSSQGNAVLAGTVYTTGIAPVTCPTGMIPVPPMPEVGLYHGFCVDKYEAKSNAGNQESVAAGTPWVSITQYNAIAECRRAGKHLITEPEWMAIARNVEDVGWNWNGGVAGTNNMSDGHSDNSPASALAADVTGDADDDPCVGTGQTCSASTWNSQRRTYQLSNGSYIWDFAGNVWEWVDQANQEDYPVANSGAAGWQACSTSGDGVCGNTRTTNDQWHRGASTALRGFIRGGYWLDGANVGAFTLALNVAPSYSLTYIGFRCSR